MLGDADPSYWDACVFLSFIEGQEDRVPDIRALLSEAERGLRSIVTSMYTIAEVAFAASERTGLDPAVEAKIDKLWRPPSPVILADFHLGIAEQARTLMRRALEHGWKLKPGDAIHLATAVEVGAQVLVTYNLADFSRWAPVLNLRVEAPHADQPELG